MTHIWIELAPKITHRLDKLVGKVWVRSQDSLRKKIDFLGTIGGTQKSG
jgi:hypothetical protein